MNEKFYIEVWYRIFKNGKHICDDSVLGASSKEVSLRIDDLELCYPKEEGYSYTYIGRLKSTDDNRTISQYRRNIEKGILVH